MDRLALLTGPTASGKSAAAMVIAERIGAEIVSFDSMQVYRGMDIGTAKPTAEEQKRIRHHLVDILDPSEEYSLGRFVEDAGRAIEEIRSRGKTPIAVGGTALYIQGFLKGVFAGPSADWAFRRELKARAQAEGAEVLYAELREVDPAYARKIHRNDLRRILRALEVYHATDTPFSELHRQFDREQGARPCRGVVLDRDRQDLHHRINRRVERMFEEGLVEEVRRLLALPGGLGRSARQALGYRQVIEHVEGRMDLHHTIVAVKKGTRQFAKRQLTWFRRFRDFRWVSVDPEASPEAMADRTLAELGCGRDE
ncbi:MAG: tRNA (adenosine(37)-N6)-dimethylallyltransferase MiaA [Planctomycetes bacterium]|nr:tRNA (adenosine(37)-N6)-dimethylallyltransferase MiaA [Planctomycetota bacterium]